MPCFSCKCFSDGKGRHGEKLSGGRGYCELKDQEYWRGHECRDFAPTWYGPKTSRSSLDEPRAYGFLNIFKRNNKNSAKTNTVIEPNMTEEFDDALFYDDEEFDDDLFYDDSEADDAPFYNPSIEATRGQAASQASKRLKTVRQNLKINSTVFDQYGITFSCNLIEDCDTLQLNFELKNTKNLTSKISRSDDLTIKANVYDISGRLLCIEETWVDYSQLKSNYAADYFYFSSDSMDKANSILVYAIDPTEDEDEDDEVSENSAAISRFLQAESHVARFNEILSDSLRLMNTTTNPKTFFGRYNDALNSAGEIVSATHSSSHREYAQEIINDLTTHRDDKIKAFVDRCNSQGKLYSIKDDLLSGQYSLTAAMAAYIRNLLQLIETENPAVPESGKYIYCSLSFGTNGKTYYYKTNDETLKCGDEVIVPIGKNGRKGIAVIEKIERFPAGKTPYPPSQTKDILGKCPY